MFVQKRPDRHEWSDVETAKHEREAVIAVEKWESFASELPADARDSGLVLCDVLDLYSLIVGHSEFDDVFAKLSWKAKQAWLGHVVCVAG